jgi:type II secretory ATPase GspE/PulE/Tfp pilus assembly ATPase PilB-like protein
MGIPAYLLPASINAIIAQRLVRKLCPHCKKAVPAEQLKPDMQAQVKRAISQTHKDELLQRVGLERLSAPTFYEPVGCDICGNTGYSGRVGIYEIMEITPPIKESIIRGESSVVINTIAIQNGMISLEQDGVMKALCGLTSLEEVYAAAKEN